PGGCSTARSCCARSGAIPHTATRGRSTFTSATCARSSRRPLRSRGWTSPYAEPDTALRRVSESAGIRPRVRFGLRPRLLAAFVLTAAVTLGAAAIALLAPLQSRLNSDAVSLTETFVEGEKTSFSIIPAHPDGTPN